jgi:hypothetical protein
MRSMKKFYMLMVSCRLLLTCLLDMRRMIKPSLLVGTLYELMYKILFQANKRLSRAVVKT